MRFCKLARSDIRNGFQKCYIYYLVLIGVVLLSCVELRLLRNAMSQHGDVYPEAVLMDYACYLFGGIKEYVPGITEGFKLPAKWMLLHVILLYGTLYYPYRDLNTLGAAVISKSGSRWAWWFSKCLWCILHQFLSYATIWVTLLVFCVAMGGRLSFDVTEELINQLMTTASSFETFLPGFWKMVVILPVLVTLGLSLFQMTLSLFVKPIFSFCAVAAILVASAYSTNPVGIGNYAMAIRSNCVVITGYTFQTAVIFSLIWIGLAVLLGIWRFRRYDIIIRE